MFSSTKLQKKHELRSQSQLKIFKKNFSIPHISEILISFILSLFVSEPSSSFRLHKVLLLTNFSFDSEIQTSNLFFLLNFLAEITLLKN